MSPWIFGLCLARALFLFENQLVGTLPQSYSVLTALTYEFFELAECAVLVAKLGGNECGCEPFVRTGPFVWMSTT